MSEDIEECSVINNDLNKKKKGHKKGIIYLSSIPPYMNVTQIREIFGQYGKIGRVYLQLEDEAKSKERKSKKMSKKFTEGWIEFERKSIAKMVAKTINNKQISNRKSSKYYDYLWNMKFLSNFKWIHLSERLAYEKAARRQKLRAEIQLAKKKNNYFTSNIGKKSKNTLNTSVVIQQKKSDCAQDRININNQEEEERNEFLKSLFT